MSESKHTPGPWEIQTVKHGDDEVGYNVNALRHDPAHASEFPYFCIESRADAHLIAAAPELLEALKALVDDIGSGTNHTCPPECIVCAAHRAIAKAEGRS